ERAPVARDEELPVRLDQPWIGGGEQILRSAPLEIAERIERRLKGQVNQAVAAQYEVGAGKLIASYVEMLEAHGIATVLLLIFTNKGRHDVRADVALQVQIQRPHPVIVAAGRVQHCPYAQIADELFDLLANDLGLGQVRAIT